MDYKVLLPVTTNPELVRQKLIDIPDLTKLIMVNNFDIPEVYDFCVEAKEKGAEVYYQPENAGLATSWNLGMRRMIEDSCDFVIFLSVSAIFNKPMQLFIDFIAEHEERDPRCRYICSELATLHCFAHTPMSVEMGGYFDENFWPIYFEDTDYGKRSKHNNVNQYITWCNLQDVVHSKGFSIAMKNPRLFKMYEAEIQNIHNYYVGKWGGTHNNETFENPFNNPDTSINEWHLLPNKSKVKWNLL